MTKSSSSFYNPSMLANPLFEGIDMNLGLPQLAGQYIDFPFNSEEDDDDDNEKTTNKQRTPMEELLYKMYGDAQEEKKYYRSPEYLDDMYKRADDLNAKQMARAQKYGKESAFYGFMYQGLPKLMAQAAFSKYAFAPEMVKGVRDAYSRIQATPAGSTQYMAVNPMGGIG
ncbi:MAG: hypothetical protein Unbinned3459contig1000_17 [Prokaryotic dsDNA virus sp.]|jgi:hypothetical protein|nr:MAG: hypothetical protein Unbinned3459contig1000_17 [Prokaryotic dsDNA virus sp.]|tara:strand:- start:9 stop:518 length:510 start_codon:yes stop_codon:yes gene_type:complete